MQKLRLLDADIARALDLPEGLAMQDLSELTAGELWDRASVATGDALDQSMRIAHIAVEIATRARRAGLQEHWYRMPLLASGVRECLSSLERAGYDPVTDDPHELQEAAEFRALLSRHGLSLADEPVPTIDPCA